MPEQQTTVERFVAALEAELAFLREKAQATRDGITRGAYLAAAERIAMIQEFQADSLERIIRSVREDDG